MDFPQKTHIIHVLFQIEIRPSQVTFLFVWPKQTVLGAWATHFKITLSYKKWYLKSWQPFRFDEIPVLGKLHIHQTLSEVPSKPGGQGKKLIPLREPTYPTQWERKLIFPTFSWDICWFSKGLVVLLTTSTWMNLFIFLSGFIAQVAPTAAFDHLQKAFPPVFWLIAMSWWMNPLPPKKPSILGLTSLLTPSFTHSPSSNSHLFKNHLQVATKTTGGHSHQKNQRIPWKFQGTSRFSRSLAIWVLWDLRSFFLKNIEFQRIQNSEKPWCWWAVCFARFMGMFLLNIKGLPSVTKYRASLWLGWRLTWKTFKTFDWQYDVTILSNICWDEKTRHNSIQLRQIYGMHGAKQTSDTFSTN